MFEHSNIKPLYFLILSLFTTFSQWWWLYILLSFPSTRPYKPWFSSTCSHATCYRNTDFRNYFHQTLEIYTNFFFFFKFHPGQFIHLSYSSLKDSNISTCDYKWLGDLLRYKVSDPHGISLHCSEGICVLAVTFPCLTLLSMHQY